MSPKHLAAASMLFLLPSCLVQRTVTDSQGHVIYQEPEVRTPFEDESKRQKEIAEREEELGWR